VLFPNPSEALESTVGEGKVLREDEYISGLYTMLFETGSICGKSRHKR
jgi:hypothetical protein